MGNKITHSILLGIIIILTCISFLLSPYDYEWEPELKQIDDDSVLVLRVIYFLMIIVAVSGLFISVKAKQKIKFIYLLFLLFLCYKMIATFFL